MLAEGLNAYLTSQAGVTALLSPGGSRADRTNGVFPVMMPEETPLPALVLTQISGSGLDSLDGANSLHTARVQVSCYGKNFGDAKKLARAVRGVLEGFRGELDEGTVVECCYLLLESDGFEEVPFIYHVPVDFEFVYQEV